MQEATVSRLTETKQFHSNDISHKCKDWLWSSIPLGLIWFEQAQCLCYSHKEWVFCASNSPGESCTLFNQQAVFLHLNNFQTGICEENTPQTTDCMSISYSATKARMRSSILFFLLGQWHEKYCPGKTLARAQCREARKSFPNSVVLKHFSQCQHFNNFTAQRRKVCFSLIPNSTFDKNTNFSARWIVKYWLNDLF